MAASLLFVLLAELDVVDEERFLVDAEGEYDGLGCTKLYGLRRELPELPLPLPERVA